MSKKTVSKQITKTKSTEDKISEFKYLFQTNFSSQDPAFICNLIKRSFPNFKNADTKYEFIFCQVFLVVCFLSTLYKDRCTIVLKGGKALQMHVPDYISDDIDLLIVPYKGYDSKQLVYEISTFILYIINNNPQYPIVSMIDNPTSNIIKISLDTRNNRPRYKPVSDIGYGYEAITDTLKNTIYSDFANFEGNHFKITNQYEGSIYYMGFQALVEEKIYYLLQYVDELDVIISELSKISGTIQTPLKGLSASTPDKYYVKKMLYQLSTIANLQEKPRDTYLNELMEGIPKKLFVGAINDNGKGIEPTDDVITAYKSVILKGVELWNKLPATSAKSYMDSR